AWESLDPRLGAATLALTFAVWAFFAFPPASRPLHVVLLRLGRDEWATRVERFVSSTSTLLTPTSLATSTLVACIGWGLEAFALTLLAAGLGLSLGVTDAFFIYATATIA